MTGDAGWKPGYKHRDRNTAEPDIVVDRTEKSISSNSHHYTKSSAISFSDPWATAEKEFELHHRTKLVSKCQGNCGRPIKFGEVMVLWSYVRITWRDKSTGKEKAKFSPIYIHFHENGLKNFSETCPRPIIWFFKNRNWSKDTRKAYGGRKNIAVVIGNKE